MTAKPYPIPNSVFDLEVAKYIADVSFRTQRPGPWVGKENELLDALWWAEFGHAKWVLNEGSRQEFQPLVRKLKGTKRKKGLKVHIDVVWAGWNSLTKEEQLQFALETHNLGETRSAAELHEEIDRVLGNLAGTAELLMNHKPPKGEIPKLGGLKRFVDRLRLRWEDQEFEEQFSWEFDSQVETDNLLFPVSAAAKLVCESLKFLPQEYSIENCHSAMKNL